MHSVGIIVQKNFAMVIEKNRRFPTSVFERVIFQQARVENFILRNEGLGVSLQSVKETLKRLKFFDMNCLSWLPTPEEGTKRESRENRELSRNCEPPPTSVTLGKARHLP